ncbi:MAG: phosphate butyryltransferase [Bacteroidetes bacterium GWF2_33_16]|nr:MAG: phosphate butyryltransferase [Bacteroidetes bacterium GWE2_32_14]OFY07144.1 MAG: phosphate butyryltransferase [Bacteroidetes bacterium GWF2_33_16]
MVLKSLNDIIELAKVKEKRHLAVAAAADRPVLEAVKNAYEAGIVIPILVGNRAEIEKISKEINFDLTKIEIFEEDDPAKASILAVSLIKEGKAEILMKGLVSTAPLLKAVLDKENGLRKGATLSHFALIESPYYHKLIGVTDAAMNIAPEFNEKVDIVNNAVEVFHRLGNKNPKVAIIGPLEIVNPKIESTSHAAMLTVMNSRGQIKGCTIDGPFAIDNAVSKEAAEHKGIHSDVAGDADILVTPELNSGNVLYKTLMFLGGCTSAAVIMGAKVPIVLTSRADTDKSKMMSIALAAAM